MDAARRSLQISTKRYKGGVTTYLEVLTAQIMQLSNERTQDDITTRQFAASVQLIAALGGGWNRTQSALGQVGQKAVSQAAIRRTYSGFCRIDILLPTLFPKPAEFLSSESACL